MPNQPDRARDGATRVVLCRDLERSLEAGHPWIYRQALRAPLQKLTTGAVVDVHTGDGRFVARGLYDARSPLAVRVVTLDAAEAVGDGLVERRFAAALRVREGAFDPTRTDAWRCVNGEGDLLPGVVVDRYGSVVVVRFEGPATVAWRAPVIAAIESMLEPSAIVIRSPGAAAEVVAGEVPDTITIVENGVRFAVDVLRGQKTGFFLDQRDNRWAVRAYAGARRVVNLFGYTGGFSVHAALAGASHVTTVDQAKPALELARANLAANGIDASRHETVASDAFAWLDAAVEQRQRYGLVVLDPPSFAPSESKLGPALEAYRRLNAAALRILGPEGILVTASCSSHVTHARFVEVLMRASADSERPLRVLEVRGQPVDHPSLPAWPEGRYLKCVIARAVARDAQLPELPARQSVESASGSS